MVAFAYGQWHYLCRFSPQPLCNLLFSQLLLSPDHGPAAAPDHSLNLPALPSDRQDALNLLGIGIDPRCSIPRMASVGGQQGSVGNVANIVCCALSVLVSLAFLIKAYQRRAAVARLEVMVLFSLYGLMTVFQLLDTGAILRQGSRSLTWITGLHHALILDFFGVLVWIGFLEFQVVEDGSGLSLAIVSLWNFVSLVGSAYIFLDTGFGITSYFKSRPASQLYSPWTFSMVLLFPLIAVFLYTAMTAIITTRVLKESKPLSILLLTLGLFILAELFRFVINQPICHSSNSKVDGSFLATIFETLAMASFFLLWTALTEEEWEDEDLVYEHPAGGVRNRCGVVGDGIEEGGAGEVMQQSKSEGAPCRD